MLKQPNGPPKVHMQILGGVAGLAGIYVVEAIAALVGGGLGAPFEFSKLVVAGLWGIWAQELLVREIQLPLPPDLRGFSPTFWAAAVGLGTGLNHVANTLWSLALPRADFLTMLLSIGIGVGTGKYAARLVRRRYEELDKVKNP